MEVGDGLRGERLRRGLKDRRVRKKKRKIRDGSEDMSGIDGMIIVKPVHEGKMRGFSKGKKKGGQVTQDGGRNCGHTRPRRHKQKAME